MFEKLKKLFSSALILVQPIEFVVEVDGTDIKLVRHCLNILVWRIDCTPMLSYPTPAEQNHDL